MAKASAADLRLRGGVEGAIGAGHVAERSKCQETGRGICCGSDLCAACLLPILHEQAHSMLAGTEGEVPGSSADRSFKMANYSAKERLLCATKPAPDCTWPCILRLSTTA